jgi:hypothetical protein
VIWKRTLKIIAILVFGVGVEIFRDLTGIPVTALDILLFPFFILVIYAVFRYLLTKHKKQKKITATVPANRALLFSFVVFVLLLPLGVWSIYIGAQHPWRLYTGVRGWVHGYTAFLLGIIITGFSFVSMGYVLWTALKRLKFIRKRKKPGLSKATN